MKCVIVREQATMILLLQILNEISTCMVAADRPTVLSTVQRRCKNVDIKD